MAESEGAASANEPTRMVRKVDVIVTEGDRRIREVIRIPAEMDGRVRIELEFGDGVFKVSLSAKEKVKPPYSNEVPF